MSLLDKVVAAVTPSKPDGRLDALDLLKKDHDEVDALFKDYEAFADGDGDADDRRALSTQICGLLAVHALIEEEIFYPAARKAKVDADLLDEAEIEHGAAKELIAQIGAAHSAEPLYDARVKVLGEYIRHHVKEEEGSCFRRAASRRWTWQNSVRGCKSVRTSWCASWRADSPSFSHLPRGPAASRSTVSVSPVLSGREQPARSEAQSLVAVGVAARGRQTTGLAEAHRSLAQTLLIGGSARRAGRPRSADSGPLQFLVRPHATGRERLHHGITADSPHRALRSCSAV